MGGERRRTQRALETGVIAGHLLVGGRECVGVGRGRGKHRSLRGRRGERGRRRRRLRACARGRAARFLRGGGARLASLCSHLPRLAASRSSTTELEPRRHWLRLSHLLSLVPRFVRLHTGRPSLSQLAASSTQLCRVRPKLGRARALVDLARAPDRRPARDAVTLTCGSPFCSKGDWRHCLHCTLQNRTTTREARSSTQARFDGPRGSSERVEGARARASWTCLSGEQTTHVVPQVRAHRV